MRKRTAKQVRSKSAGLILAAGRSRRLGQPKALVHLHGQQVIHRLIDVYVASGIAPIVVVCQGETRIAIEDREEIDIVIGNPEGEMIDSVILGLEALPKNISNVIVQPVDAAFTSEEMIAALLDGQPGVTRVLCHQGQPGHPVQVPRSLFHEIQNRPKEGLRGVLAEHDVELVEWPDPTILADLDTEADLRRWQVSSPALLH